MVIYRTAGLLEGMNTSIYLKVFSSSLFIDIYDTCRRQERIFVVSFLEIGGPSRWSITIGFCWMDCGSM